MSYKGSLGDLYVLIKSHVNWDEVNFIVDKLTSYEDDGDELHIDLRYYTGGELLPAGVFKDFSAIDLVIDLYNSESQYEGYRCNTENVNSIIDNFDKDRLVYRVSIGKYFKRDLSDNMVDILTKLLHRMKCVNVQTSKDGQKIKYMSFKSKSKDEK